MQLSHVLRQANAGLQMPWRDEALEVMAEHLGVRQTNHPPLEQHPSDSIVTFGSVHRQGVALEQYRQEMQALEAREKAQAEAEAEAEAEELARL